MRRCVSLFHILWWVSKLNVLRWPPQRVVFDFSVCCVFIHTAKLRQFPDTTKFRHLNWADFQQELTRFRRACFRSANSIRASFLHSLTRNLGANFSKGEGSDVACCIIVQQKKGTQPYFIWSIIYIYIIEFLLRVNVSLFQASDTCNNATNFPLWNKLCRIVGRPSESAKNRPFHREIWTPSTWSANTNYAIKSKSFLKFLTFFLWI